jgi:hypothetical protein
MSKRNLCTLPNAGCASVKMQTKAIAFNSPAVECEGSQALMLSEMQCMQVLVEQSLLGWKEYELEVMRDLADNVVIVCSIENVDPMGVHTGDSITVAPQQTLTDREYQRLRDASVAIIREMGVECGGSNVQLATNPATGEMVIIEMNPRVSRYCSSPFHTEALLLLTDEVSFNSQSFVRTISSRRKYASTYSSIPQSCMQHSISHAEGCAQCADTCFRQEIWCITWEEWSAGHLLLHPRRPGSRSPRWQPSWQWA